MIIKEAILLTNIRKSHVGYIQVPMNGCIAKVVVLSWDDIRLHLASVVLDSELKLGCVKDNLEMKMLAKFNVNQLLLWNSLNECRNKFELRLGCVENVACQIEKGKMAGSILDSRKKAPRSTTITPVR